MSVFLALQWCLTLMLFTSLGKKTPNLKSIQSPKQRPNGNPMQLLFPMCSHACIRGFQTTGVKESYYSGGWPPRIYSHFPLLPPISSLSASSSSYHPYTACPGETAVEDIMLCCGDPWESKTKGKWGVKGETVKDGKDRSSRGNAGVLAIYTFLYIFFNTSFPLVFAP